MQHQAAKILQSQPEEGGSKDRGDQSWSKLLREVSLFSDISHLPGAVEGLCHELEERDFAPEAVIIGEGDTGSEMFFLLEGEAGVYKRTPEGDHYKVFILKSANRAFFGEGGLLDNEARSATIRAESKCRCLVLSRDAFQKFGKSHPEWALPVLIRIAQAVMTRLRKTNNDLMLLYNALVAEIRGT